MLEECPEPLVRRSVRSMMACARHLSRTPSSLRTIAPMDDDDDDDDDDDALLFRLPPGVPCPLPFRCD